MTRQIAWLGIPVVVANSLQEEEGHPLAYSTGDQEQ